MKSDYYNLSSISGIFKSFGDNERGFKGDPDGSWGWALENGATMIQTDRPVELIKYLESKGRRNL